MSQQRIIFTVENATTSRDASQTELMVEGNLLILSSEAGVLPGWSIVYESEEEARRAFNRINTALADGEPVVYVPGPGFMKGDDV